GRELIQEGGKDGVVVFHSTIARLSRIVHAAARISARPSSNPVRPFHTRRVALALGELASYLSTAEKRASEIRRRTLEVTEHLSREENVVLESAQISSRPTTQVYYVEVAERLTPHGWSAVAADHPIVAGDQLKLNIFGSFANPPVALYFDHDISVERIQEISERKVVAIVKVKEGNPKIGWHDLMVEDCEQQRANLSEALYISRRLTEARGGKIGAKFDPCCGHQGDEKVIKFYHEGDDQRASSGTAHGSTDSPLAGSGVCFGSGRNIRVRSATYTKDG